MPNNELAMAIGRVWKVYSYEYYCTVICDRKYPDSPEFENLDF